MHHLLNRILWGGAAVFITALGSGCATMGASYDDPSDICYAYRVELIKAKNFYAEHVIAGAVAGAVIGGLAGILAGGKDRGKAAAIGAASGAVIGGIGGYYEAKQQESANVMERAKRIRSDVLNEFQHIDLVTLAFINLRKCRLAAASRIKADYRAHRISRNEAVQRMNDLRQRFIADIEMAEQIGVQMEDKAKQYQYAMEQTIKEDPRTRATLRIKAAKKLKSRKSRRSGGGVIAQGDQDSLTNASHQLKNIATKSKIEDLAAMDVDAPDKKPGSLGLGSILPFPNCQCG